MRPFGENLRILSKPQAIELAQQKEKEMAERKIKQILISTPDFVGGNQVPNVVSASVSDGFIWFEREGFALRWKLEDWEDLIDFVDGQNKQRKEKRNE